MNGERVGNWTLQSNGIQQFAYDPSWLESPVARPISLSLLLRREPHKSAAVAAYFDNLLPDSQPIRERLQQRFRTESANAFDLLTEIGRDCVGALQLLPEDKSPGNLKRIRGEPLTERDVEQQLASAIGKAWRSTEDTDNDAFRVSLAGAQEKTALLWHGTKWHQPAGATPTTHILKLPIGLGNRGIDLTTSVENEWLCAEIVRAYGISTAKCQIRHFGRYKVLVVERFDRKLADDGKWWIRLPQEDLCQATGTPPDLKYENDGGPGIRRIMELLLGSDTAEADRRDFMRTQLIFWLLCAIDGHAKNFSLFLQPQGSYRLTPRYDILSAYPMLGNGPGKLRPQKVKMAMAVEGKNRHYHRERIQRRHWMETGHRCGISAADLKHTIEDVIERTPQMLSAVAALVPKDFPSAVLEKILTGVAQAAKRLEAMTG